MIEELNQTTQPQLKHPVFNNWDVIPLGWYYLCPSSDIKTKQIKSFQIGTQKIVCFRGEDGKPRTLDSFCAHMGADLQIGDVKGNHLRCFFHQWSYDGTGKVIDIPCQKEIPNKADIHAYPTREKYGAIWVYPGKTPDRDILEVPGLEGKEVVSSIAKKPNISQSHHHISMINGIDPQHLKTIHNLSIDMDLELNDDRNHIQFILSGKTPENTIMEKITKFMIGPQYSYAMKYADACLASLTLMRGVHFLKPKWKWPELHMFYAYRPGVNNKSYTYPIYVAERKPGLKGWLSAHFKIWLTKKMYLFLKDEDDIIYENIRFNPKNLISIDSPVTKYIAYVNRLTPSPWSRK